LKIVEIVDLIQRGDFPKSKDWEKACNDVNEAILCTDWPHGSGTFKIYPERKGNGVVPIKKPCIEKLKSLGWVTENLPPIGLLEGSKGKKPGDLDAIYHYPSGYVAFEWETGNISSSHRAIGKLLWTLKQGGIKGGFLVIPSNRLKIYLTDRIGNIGELRPYFDLWRDLNSQEAALRILVVEHDEESENVPKIPKGTDGRAKG